MRKPLDWIRARVVAVVRREVADAVATENIDVLRGVISEKISPQIAALEHLMGRVIERLDHIDGRVQVNESTASNVVARLDATAHDLQVLNSRIRADPYRKSPIEMVSSFDGSSTIGFDARNAGQYIDFVEVFRPSFDELQAELSGLTKWFPTSGRAVDLGAGRGEMVKVMTDHGLESFGVDADASVVAAAQERGLDVRESSIDAFLTSANSGSLNVVSAIQVVEHVDAGQLESWFGNVRRILSDGGVFVVETPNPHAIDAFKAFWIDVTHVRPYYPESLLHMAQSAGFSRAEIWAPGTQNQVKDRLEFAGSYVLIATA
jgi:SAM-dependent methyltransferase